VKADGARRPPLPGPLGRLSEVAYLGVVRRRNRAFDAGRRVERLPVPVISVGNLSVGGTGKTPIVMAIVQQLIASERQPAIAMRGYRASDEEGSDEQREYLDRFPDTPIVARPDRIVGLRALLGERSEIDCVVLDDGFQHRFIARELDIVLLDASRDPLADRCLPAGWLREPLDSLRRAHMVIVTHCERVTPDEVDRIEQAVRRLKPDLLVARARHVWTGVEHDGGVERAQWLRGKQVIAASAVGNNEAFVAGARDAGAEVVGAVLRRDHHRWGAADLEAIRRLAERNAPVDGVLTTRKDWVKMRRAEAELPCPVLRTVLEVEFDTGAEALRSAVMRTFRQAASPGGVLG